MFVTDRSIISKTLTSPESAALLRTHNIHFGAPWLFYLVQLLLHAQNKPLPRPEVVIFSATMKGPFPELTNLDLGLFYDIETKPVLPNLFCNYSSWTKLHFRD